MGGHNEKNGPAQSEPVIDPATQQPFTYTLSDFDTSAPYDYVLEIKDDFLREMVAKALEKHAKSVHMRVGFRKALTARQKSRKRASQLNAIEAEPNIISFQDAEIDLEVSGEWRANEHGVYKVGPNGPEYACSHPIYPAERLRNIDTGELKVRLAWRRGEIGRQGYWGDIVTDYSTIANAKDIVKLANLGIGVTSSRAKNLVDYLADVMDANYDQIPERKSVSRLGWNAEGGFSPYVGDVIFDGNDAFGRTYASIHPHGDYEKWKAEIQSVREYSLLARIVLASSFASVLVGPMNCLPFFVHLWGMDSETGKTVAQMVAASVWGEPTPGGEYFKTFKSTTVGFEVMAGFFRSLPIVIDELQLAKDAKGRIIFNVYELASGSGKMRSNTKLGIAATPRWANCFITSGETPITGEQDGAGALNRVVEIECTAENKVIENGHRTAEAMKAHYGHAGKEFVEILSAEGMLDFARKRYEELFLAYTKGNAADKQSHSAALITLADELATKWIFQDGRAITVSELSGFLKSKAAISAAERGYEYVCDWVAQNMNRFNDKAETGEIYGRFPSYREQEDDGHVYIIRSVFNQACANGGINPKALLSHLRTKGIIQTRDKGFTKSKRIGEIAADCIVFKLQNQDYIDLPGESCNFP